MIDSHCHLNDEIFDNDREKVIQKAKDNGVVQLVNIGSGYGLKDNYKSLEISKNSNGYIFSTIGIHPHDASMFKQSVYDELINLYSNNQDIIKAVGEIGLDYHYDFSPRDIQKRTLREMIKLAKEINLPVVIHSREAEPDVFNILKEEKADKVGGIMHCFSGTAEEAIKYVENLGFYISFSGVVTFKNAQETRNAVKSVPLNKILIETDAPYLTPVPFRGKRNEPAYVKYTLEKIAEIKNISVEEIEKITEVNTKTIFNLK